ncbi:hypothetical protein SARC_04959 [Sphaeroforma arctica JP610]|uniref:Uncharacterized protein n=1 Tax=Sphaeroforma arctica JP610 TaxID=667725 RepID=A0A0L0G1P4_9EUKA|nr:hypothetical protein SARC_04959 [Sphaeroforma arctica JP610]KNC82759.1 hypothetical protein SARC_04959 [Sphaeroforma arctica JP610]|eukprot:XP_014156661.1 hypothetical protein SARC_04959 [Sphaeroforma arctica JP610]
MYDYEVLYDQPNAGRRSTLGCNKGKVSCTEQDVSVLQLQRYLDVNATPARDEFSRQIGQSTTESMAIEIAMEKQRRKEWERKQKVLSLMRSKNSSTYLTRHSEPPMNTVRSTLEQSRTKSEATPTGASLMDQVMQEVSTR